MGEHGKSAAGAETGDAAGTVAEVRVEAASGTVVETAARAAAGKAADTQTVRNARRCGHIVLIGFMGAGKSTVGRWLSRKLSRQLLDTDAMIEAGAGMTISEIFATRGEEAFRAAETEVLTGLAARRQPVVISTGGGLPVRAENREALRKLGCVVYLRVKPETVCERLAGDHSRPLLAGDDRQRKVESLLAQRGPIYEETAHLTVDVDGRTPEMIGEEILGRMDARRSADIAHAGY